MGWGPMLENQVHGPGPVQVGAEVESSEGGHLLPSSVPPGLESWLPVQTDVGFSSRESPSFLCLLEAEAPMVAGGLWSHQLPLVLRPLGPWATLTL